MATITTRSGKGSPLTNTELDANFTNLNTDKVEKSGDSMTGNLTFGDNDKAIFGAGSDLQIYHNGTDSKIYDGGTGNLTLESNGTQIELKSSTGDMVRAVKDSEVVLFYNGSRKLATTSTGIDVTGTVTADGLTVDTPTSALALKINGRSTGAQEAWQYFYKNDASTINAGILGDNNGLKIAVGSSPTYSASFANNGDISFYEDTGTTAKFFWDASAESLGIGTTPDTTPSTKLHIREDDSVDYKARMVVQASDQRMILGSHWQAGVTQYSYIQCDNDAEGWYGSPLLLNPEGGNVGIGTTSPSAPLHIAGTSTLSTELKVGNLTWNTSSSSTSGILHQYRGSDGYSELQINNTASSGANVLTIRDGSGVKSALYNDGSAKFTGVYLGGTGSANYLDDYEEGTFTMGIAGYTGGFTTNYGRYTKVGRLVHFRFQLRASSSVSAEIGTATINVTGLPFVDTNDGIQSVFAVEEEGIGGTWDYLTGFVQTNNNYFRIRKNTNNATVTNLDGNDWSGTSSWIQGAGVYYSTT